MGPVANPQPRFSAWRRQVFALLALISIPVGLLSRHFARCLPALLRKPPGDVIWALMVYWIAAALLPRRSWRSVAAAAGLYSLATEVLKLNHAPILAAMRSTRMGRLIFGSVFSWSNLGYYAIGIAIAATIDNHLVRKRGRITN